MTVQIRWIQLWLAVAVVLGWVAYGSEPAYSAVGNEITEQAGFPVYTLDPSASCASNVCTQSLTIDAVGDLVVVGGSVNGWSVSVTGASDTSGRVRGWSCSNYSYWISNKDVYLCWGTAQSAGSTTLQITTSGALPSPGLEINTDEFTASLGATTAWSKDASGTRNNAVGANVTWPNLVPTVSGSLYWGYAEVTNVLMSGTGAAGWTLEAPNANGDGEIWAANTAINAGTPVQPTAGQSPLGSSATIAAVFSASLPPSTASLPRSTAPPGITVAGQDGGDTVVGEQASTTGAAWTLNGTQLTCASAGVTCSYQWQRCDLSGGNCSNATGTGATTATYTADETDVGQTLRVVVTVSVAGVSASASAAPTAEVVGGTPSTVSVAKAGEYTVATNGCGGGTGCVNGNGYGNEKQTVARAGDGTLFTVYNSAGPDDPNSNSANEVFHLMKCASPCMGAWTTVGTGDAGQETPALLLGPDNSVYLVTWPGTNDTSPGSVTANACPASSSGVNTAGTPHVVGFGVLGAGPVICAVVPPTNESLWSGQVGCCHYASAAIDMKGNVYIQENYALNLNNADFEYQGAVAWTSGGTGNWTWHSTRLPGIGGTGSSTDYRYSYTFDLPDLNGDGGFDVVGTRNVSTDTSTGGTNTVNFDSAYGYGIPAGSGIGCSGYVYDRIDDWHTDNLNAAGGPTWTTKEVAQHYGGACRGGVNFNVFADDAYRDTYGNLHVLWEDDIAGNENQTILGLVSGSWQVKNAAVSLPIGYCSSGMRMTQDYTGRFYVIASCAGSSAESIYVWAGDTTDGTTITQGVRPVATTTLNNNFTGHIYVARPQGGTALTKDLNFAGVFNSYQSISEAQVNLASSP